MKSKLNLAALLALASPFALMADVKVNDALTVSGYAVGSYKINDTDKGPSSDRMDMDTAKTMFTTNFKPVTGVVSLFYQPGAPSEVTVLDAYATVDVGGGSTITAGKFLSYLGYEAFDIPNMSQISYANGDFLGPIPGYHSGVKWDYADKDFGVGLALLDSVYSGSNYLKGDGELKHNAGYEGYVTYKGIKDLTLWAGFAYDSEGNIIHKKESILTFDFWAEIALSKDSKLAFEYATKDGGLGDKGNNWLVFYGYNFDAKWSAAFRLSGEQMKGGSSFTKYTVSPTYKINDNFSVRAEFSSYDYKKYAAAGSATMFGIQAIFKF
jgi:hypothetical protein